MVIFNKTINIFFWAPVFIIGVDAILKLLGVSICNDLSMGGLQDFIRWLGLIELSCLVLFSIQKTQIPGLFMLSCYWCGITVIGLLYHSFNLFPLIMQALIIIATYARDHSNEYYLKSENITK